MLLAWRDLETLAHARRSDRGTLTYRHASQREESSEYAIERQRKRKEQTLFTISSSYKMPTRRLGPTAG